MKRNILLVIIFGLGAFFSHLSFSAESDHKWWGVEMEGAPSIGSRLQGTTLQLNIDDIAGLEGEVRSPTVMITCPSEIETHLVTHRFLKISANKFFVNGEECECLPLRLKECTLSNLLFSMNALTIKSIPVPMVPQAIKINSILQTDFLVPLQKIIEIIAQDYRENKMRELTIKKGTASEYRCKLSKAFNIEMDWSLMLSKKTTNYIISSLSCQENQYQLPGGHSEYSFIKRDLRPACSMESSKRMFKKFIEAYNNLKINPDHYKEKFELELFIDPRHENSCLILKNINKLGVEMCRLLLHIEPESITGLISTDF